MKRPLFLNALSIVILIVNLLPVSVVAAAPAENNLPKGSAPLGRLASVDAVLPAWFAAPPSSDPIRPATSGNVLPGWFTAYNQPPADLSLSPVFQPLQTPIAEALLSVEVFGPPVASLGSPVGGGEVYTAVIRNTSSLTAYNIYLTSTHQVYFIHDGGDQIISSTGTIPFNLTTGPTDITWTPNTTFNLGIGQVITLSFRLRATCNAQSGQQMRVGIRYNADPPPASPIELNTGGLNITTGRGNLVIKKEPAIQNLGTPDFGKPITWTVTVQNTGLGALYDAIVTDTGGIGLSQPSGDLVPTATIPMLGINETRVFTVVGTVQACNFTNVAQGAWSCGNLVGDATYANPISSTASVLFSPQIPNINVQVSSPITFPYCNPVTRTVAVTIANSGGPGANFRLDSTFESDGFLDVIPASVSSGWQYTSSGVFSFIGGSPTGTIPGPTGAAPVTLTFQIRPRSASVCDAGNGHVEFTPLYNDICSGDPFTGNVASLVYQYAQGQAPTLHISKSAPSVVASGQVFTYQVTVYGENPANINGAINITDLLPSEFVLSSTLASTGTATIAGQNVYWYFDPPPSPSTFSETLTYQVRAVVTRTLCGASQIVNNNVRTTAIPTCPGCSILSDTAQVNTAIANNEGVSADHSANGSLEACGNGLTIVNRYAVTGTTIVTWTGATFTDALGIDIGDGALPPGTPPLIYVPGSLSVTIGATDYTALLTPTTTVSGQLVIDLTPLQAAGAPTQNLTLLITYTVEISEASLNGLVDQPFYDWSQLYLPNLSDVEGCASNSAFNQVLPLTIGRGDLSVGLDPPVLDRCRTNTAIIHVNDNTTGRLTDHIVVTFTSSSAEIMSARNFTYTGALASVGPITVITNTNIGGGRGMITFTLPVGADIDGNGDIRFEVDVNCSDDAPWNAGITFLSRCAVPHSRATSLAHTYRAPDLTLFATPIEYTVRNKDVIWKFFATNNGNLTATNVVITNAIYGLSVVSYTANSGAGNISIAPTLPVSNPPDVGPVFTISELAPNEQREVTVTAKILLCTPLGVDITARLDCFGTTCKQLQKHISFNTPDPYLLTNNGQTADLPMCDLGFVVFRTKNASADVTLYQLDITETLRALRPDYTQPFTVSIVDRNGALITLTTAFTPEITTAPTQTLMVWKAISAPMGMFDSLDPLAVVVITVPVRTSCVPPDSPQSFAGASALAPCNKQLGYAEDAVTLQTMKPDMSIVKEGKGPTGDFDKTVYADPGDIVTWRIRVRNLPSARSYVAHNAVLSDTWPTNFQFITATTNYSPTIITASNTITWNVGDVGVNDELVFFITGTLTGAACQLQTINTSRLSFGCADGCASSAVPMDTANLNSNPDLRVILSPGPLQTCQGDIPITIRNYAAPAYSTTLTVTLPSGYVYSQTVGATLTPTEIITSPNEPRFRWNLIPGRVPPAPYYAFTLTLRVRNSASSGQCPVDNGRPVTATLEYDNNPVCTLGGPFFTSTTTTLNVVSPQLQIVKTPRTRTVDAGQRITWTITLTNTGTGIAENVVVTDVAGSNYTSITATNGGIVAGNVITWTPAPISATRTFTAQVSAVVISTGDNRNVVTATAGCATGCQTAVVSNTAYTTLLQDFQKNPAIQTGTIGSLVVFTFTGSLPDQDALYQRLTLTDSLPTGLGYISSWLAYQYDGDGNSGGPVDLISSTPTISPAYLQTGNIIWRLGDLLGTVQINGVITTVIRDIPSNYGGLRLTNILTMTYTDDNQPYVYTDTSPVDVLEPVLHIGKSYTTPYGCNATLFQDNFNRSPGAIGGGWGGGSAGWNVANGMAVPGTGGNQRTYNGNTAWTDYSFSAMISSTDTSGDIGLIFRAQATDQNYYRFVWNRGGTNSYRLQRVYNNGANTLDLLPAAGSAYVTNRWYHIEIRVEGNRFRVYIDGNLALDRTDNYWTTGRIGLYANNQNAAGLDDVLVTRLGNSGCAIGANDLVTYTLTISNQSRLPGYDLVITDVVPTDLSLITYTMRSSDPASAITAEPAPIPGATGVLTWGVNQLTPTVPFSPLVHTALTLTVVMRVSPGITANIVLSNQASLAYDNWPGNTSPTTITRGYSGGSHSTAIQTTNSGLTKTITFSPPPTATLGSLITYTLIVPAPPISATLYGVVITDTVNPSMTIEAVTTSGGTGGLASWSGQTVTATFTSVPSYTQAFVTITARISSALGAYAGYVITNSAVMTHVTAPQITTTPPISTVVGEPRLVLVKASAPPTSNTVGAGNNVTYTVTITNWSGPYASPAYDVAFTDTLPAGMRNTSPGTLGLTLNGSPVSASAYVTGYNSTTGVFTVTFTPVFSIPVGGTLVISYVARADAGVGVGVDLSNLAQVGWSSLWGATPGDRDYGPMTGTTTIHTVRPSLIKTVVPPTATLGSIITYTILLPQPPITATIYNAVVTDRLDSRLMLQNVDGSPDGVVTTSGNAFTVTYANIVAGDQRSITITAVLSDPLGAVAGDVITNVAVLSHSTGITTSAPVTITVTEPRVTLDKSVQTPRTPVGAGDIVTYRMVLSNTGTWPAYDVLITDSLPNGLSFVATQQFTVTNPVTATRTDNNVAGSTALAWSASQLNVGGYIVISFTARVSDAIGAGLTLTNAAWGSYTSQPGPTPGERTYPIPTDTVPITTGLPVLNLTKTAVPSPVQAGDYLTYTLTVSNTGIVSATGVVITDVVPANTSFVTATLPHTGPDAGNVITWPLGTLDIGPPATPRVVTMVVQVASPLITGTIITNIAWVTSTEGISRTTTITTPVASAHTLAITKTATPSPVQAGDVLTYTLAWAVFGNEPSLGTTISDTVPTHTIFITATTPVTVNGSLLTWPLGDRNPGDFGAVTFTVQVTQPLISGTLIVNSAVITDRQSISDTHTITTPVISSHSLAITKTATPSPVEAGGLLTYTLAWSVAGNEPALNVTLSDTVPTNTTFITATLPVTVNGSLLTWPLGNRNPGDSGFVTFTVQVTQPLVSGTLILNSAVITDSQGVTRTSTVTTPVTSAHALTITKTATPSPVAAGDLLTYTLAYTVTGNEPALNVTLSDTTPQSTTFWSAAPLPASAPTPGNTGPVIWQLGVISPPATGAVTMVVRVDSPLLTGTQVVNGVVITDSQGVTNTNTVTTPVASAHALTITKTATPSPVAAGNLLTYTLAYTVTGNEPALNVTISDTTPQSTTFWSAAPLPASAPTPGNTGPVVWQLGIISPPATGAVTMVVRVDSPLLTGTQVVNGVVITDSQGITNTSTVTTPVISSHSLAITKTATPSPVEAGGLLTYTLAWSVAGNEPALNVTLSDTVPMNTTFITATLPVTVNGSLLTWPLGDRNPGASGQVTFTVQVTQPLISGTLILNSAVITDSQGVTKTSAITTPVISNHWLVITKTAEPATVQPSGTLVYTLTWAVFGTEPALDVTISDTVPANTTLITTTTPVTVIGPLLIWSLGNHNPGDTGLVTFTVQVASPLLSGTLIVNAAVITDSQGVTNTGTVATPVTSQHIITLTKSAIPSPVQAGDLLTYTLLYTITGNGVAPDVTLSDTTPQSTTFWSAAPLPASAPAPGNAGVVIWQLGAISPPVTGAVTMVVRVNSPLVSGTQIYNAAIITDSQGVTNTGSITTPVAGAHTLAIIKTVEPAIAYAGGILTYTLSWAVSGNEPAFDVTISDTVPASTTFITGTMPVTVSGSLLLWGLGTVNPPASGFVTFTVQVDNAAVSGTQIYNAAIIADSQGVTSTGATTAPVQTAADVAIVKLDNPDPVIAGTLLTYTLVVTNNGPADAVGVMVADTLPPEVTFVSAIPTPSSIAPLTWFLGTLTPGEVRYLAVTVRVSLAATQTFTNTAVVSSTTPDSNPRNNRDDQPTTPLAPGMELAKSVTPGNVGRNQPFTYTLRITNTGQVTFDPLVITDTLPPNVHYIVGTGVPSDPNVIAEPLLRWNNLGPLAPLQSIAVSFAVTIGTGMTGTYINVALAEGDTPGGPITRTDTAPVILHNPAIVLEKQLTSYDQTGPAPHHLTFTIAITNVGVTVIDVLPLLDQYDPYYLSFVWASPMPDEPADDGLLTWHDLTAPAPNGFGRNLALGDSFFITTVFTVAHDITTTTYNIVTATGGIDTYNNPTNNPTSTVPIPNIPTAVELLYFHADGVGGQPPYGDLRQVRLTWATAVEIDNFGFNLYRANSNDFARAQLVHFEPAAIHGRQLGATYIYTDTVPFEGVWWYWLTDVDTQGNEGRPVPATARVEVNTTLPYRVYLPLVMKQ